MVLFCLAVTAAVTYGIFELVSLKTILPFVMMLFAIVLYFLSKTIIKISRTFYYKGILLANSFSLVLFYFSEIICRRELSVLLLNAEITTGHDISFAFFYGFTFVVPLFYLVYSLIKKDRKML
jgi:hypothetical protein